MRLCGCGDRSSTPDRASCRRRGAVGGGGRTPAAAAGGRRASRTQRAILANQQLEVRAFLVRKLEKHLLSRRILEPFTIFLEELMRAALAPDPDQERLLVVHALAQLLGALREDAAGRALEEQERRPRFELWIGGNQLVVALFERREVFLLLLGQLPEH